MSDRPVRKRPAHGVLLLPNKPTMIFDTVCTKNRSKWLADAEVHDVLKAVWQQADAWKVGKYVVMPDHIHMFVAHCESDVSYEDWCKYWKSMFTKSFSTKHGGWQSGHWDTRMRTEDQMEEKWDYIQHNPVRHGLAESPEAWPYRGEIFQFTWT
ncbi:MAG: transposase [Planctomycetaceae bacterium]|nr:transposase [Planctomycetaceae bacterium]